MDFSHLQNGSDIRGVALEGVAGENVTLTEDAVRHIARGFAAWLRKKTGKDDPCVSVGRDSRLSGESIAGWLTDELSRLGLDSADMGLATTPAMFMTTVTEGYLFDGAVMITASHLPWNRNGLKFFTAAGGAESADIREILAYDGPVAPAARPGRAEKGAFSPKASSWWNRLSVSTCPRSVPPSVQGVFVKYCSTNCRSSPTVSNSCALWYACRVETPILEAIFRTPAVRAWL